MEQICVTVQKSVYGYDDLQGLILMHSCAMIVKQMENCTMIVLCMNYGSNLSRCRAWFRQQAIHLTTKRENDGRD